MTTRLVEQFRAVRQLPVVQHYLHELLPKNSKGPRRFHNYVCLLVVIVAVLLTVGILLDILIRGPSSEPTPYQAYRRIRLQKRLQMRPRNGFCNFTETVTARKILHSFNGDGMFFINEEHTVTTKKRMPSSYQAGHRITGVCVPQQGFPTMLVFGADKDSPIPYEGARSASGIESFALEHLKTNVSPPEVTEITSSDVMEEKCGSAAICFVAFLPDILDSKAEGRNKNLEMLLSVAEKFKRSPYSYVWTAAGKQPELEQQVGVGGYGYPALIALNVKKGVYAPLRSAFEQEHIIEFVRTAGLGGKGNLPLDGTPVVVNSEPWDGEDGQIIEEDEFSLEELMAE